jgi:hypothetical protein
MNPHGTVESSFQHRFAVSVWCGMLRSQIVGRLSSRVILQMTFIYSSAERMLGPLEIRVHMHSHQDGAPAHLSRAVITYPEHRSICRWVGRSGPWSTTLAAWAVEGLVYQHRVTLLHSACCRTDVMKQWELLARYTDEPVCVFSLRVVIFNSYYKFSNEICL